MPNPAPRPFRIDVEQSVLDDLKARLTRVRWPDEPPLAPWSSGTSLAYMKQLVDYWRDRFDWRAQEAKLNAFPQFTVPLAGIDLHFIHEQGKGPAPVPLLLSHGWPGSVFEFHKIIPMLTDPARFGGDPADAFTVVAPSLPGYGFSFRPGQERFGVEGIADIFARLMTDVLGYQRFAAQGGDWGGFVTSRLGLTYPERLYGIHVNLLAIRRDPKMLANPTAEEKVFLEQLTYWLKEEIGYQCDPGYQAADPRLWIVRFAGGAGGVDHREVSHVERLRRRRRERIHQGRAAHQHHAVLGHRRDRFVVLALLRTHARSVADPRRLARRGSDRIRGVPARDSAATALSGGVDVQHSVRWTKAEKGGHFAALEQPQKLAEEVRAFFRPLRQVTSR